VIRTEVNGIGLVDGGAANLEVLAILVVYQFRRRRGAMVGDDLEVADRNTDYATTARVVILGITLEADIAENAVGEVTSSLGVAAVLEVAPLIAIPVVANNDTAKDVILRSRFGSGGKNSGNNRLDSLDKATLRVASACSSRHRCVKVTYLIKLILLLYAMKIFKESGS
jgi:hypothetical protein